MGWENCKLHHISSSFLSVTTSLTAGIKKKGSSRNKSSITLPFWEGKVWTETLLHQLHSNVICLLSHGVWAWVFHSASDYKGTKTGTILIVKHVVGNAISPTPHICLFSNCHCCSAFKQNHQWTEGDSIFMCSWGWQKGERHDSSSLTIQKPRLGKDGKGRLQSMFHLIADRHISTRQ